MPLLEARRITFEYPGPIRIGAARALDGVDIVLEPGDLTAVIGPNGSGKSTLVRLLAGLLEPAGGEILLEGRPLRSIPPRDRARSIAVVPQFLPALPEVRVEDFVASARYARIGRFASASAADREAVARALEQCEASDLADRAVADLSGGQRQRVLIARALAQEARVLLVDEPTSGLDPEHQLRVLELVAPLSARSGRAGSQGEAVGEAGGGAGGQATLFVTHDLNLAGQFAESVVLLDRGRIAAAGRVESVLRREVLEPVYGEHLHYGTWPSGAGAGRPYVLAHRSAESFEPRASRE